MPSVHHYDHPCRDPLRPESAYPARGTRKDFNGNLTIAGVVRKQPDIKLTQIQGVREAATSVPCENCGGQGGWLDISDEDEEGPLEDWFDCPVCYGTGEYEPRPRLITLEDFEECFGWR